MTEPSSVALGPLPHPEGQPGNPDGPGACSHADPRTHHLVHLVNLLKRLLMSTTQRTCAEDALLNTTEELLTAPAETLNTRDWLGAFRVGLSDADTDESRLLLRAILREVRTLDQENIAGTVEEGWEGENDAD